MTADARSRWSRLPGGDTLLRGYALTAGSLLLAGYALFLTLGPAAASPFLGLTVPPSILVFAVLLVRRPAYLLVIGALFGAIALASVYSLIVEWDARSIWFYHARFIVEGAGPRELLGPDRPFSHPQYPKMLPLVAATVARTAGFWNEALPKLAIPVLLSVPLAYILGAWRGWLYRCLLLAAIFLICGRFLWNGYVDGILAIYAVAALGAGLRYLDGGRARDGWCLAVLAALLPTLKTEGLLACAAVLFALALRCLATGEWRQAPRMFRQLALPLAACLTIALGWFVHVRLISVVPDIVFRGDPISRMLERLGDGHSLWQIWRAMFVNDYQIVWPVAAAVLFLAGTSDVRRSAGPFVVAAVSILAGITTVYLLTNADLAWHLRTSVDRTTMTPVLLLAAALIPFKRVAAAHSATLAAGWSAAGPGNP